MLLRADKRRGRGRRGFALPAVLIALVVAMLSCGAYLTVAFHEYNESVRQEKHAQAFFLAEAGRQRALHRADNSASFGNITGELFSGVELGPGTYTVTVSSPTSGEATIVSTGRVDEQVRTIQMDISRD